MVVCSCSKFTKGEERDPSATVFRVPLSESYGFECLEKMEFIHQNTFEFMPSGGGQTYSLDNLNLLAEHLPNPVLGMKHVEKLLAEHPEPVPGSS